MILAGRPKQERKIQKHSTNLHQWVNNIFIINRTLWRGAGKCAVSGEGSGDNDSDPSVDPPPTVDHPLTESLMLPLAAQKLLIKITHRSATNEPGMERRRARSREQDGK